MECLGKLVWTNYTREELAQLKIDAPDTKVREAVQKNWDSVAKPLDGMGRFEELIARIGAITGQTEPTIGKRAVIMMCADNGIVEEGVSQSGQEVTLAVAQSMARRRSSVGRMAEVAGADTIPVDIGIKTTQNIAGVVKRKVRCGTRNFHKEPAMTEEETLRAIAVGIDMVSLCRKAEYQILATGEMGIGNTTTGSAVAAALLGCDASVVTGKGAGLSDAGLLHKRQVIQEAIECYDLYHADALTVLATVGGLDIAGLAGVCIGGALYHIPIVLDGVISMVAGLVAERILPGVKEYLLASHKGKEPAVALLTQALGLEPVLDARMALGEGTGAVMLFPLLDMAMSVYQNRTTFAEIQIEQYTRY